MSFAGMVTKAEGAIPQAPSGLPMSAFTTFNISGLELMHSLVMPLVLIFTVANAIVPSLAEGGSRYKIFNNLAMTAAISGICLLVLPVLANTLFATVSQL